jgi:hypothetical protein
MGVSEPNPWNGIAHWGLRGFLQRGEFCGMKNNPPAARRGEGRLRFGVSARTPGASCAGALWRCASPEEYVPLRGHGEGSLRRSACGGSGRSPSSRLRQPRSARRPPTARRTECKPACTRARRMRDVSRAPLLRRARAPGRACPGRCLKAPARGKIRGEALIVSEVCLSATGILF